MTAMYMTITPVDLTYILNFPPHFLFFLRSYRDLKPRTRWRSVLDDSFVILSYEPLSSESSDPVLYTVNSPDNPCVYLRVSSSSLLSRLLYFHLQYFINRGTLPCSSGFFINPFWSLHSWSLQTPYVPLYHITCTSLITFFPILRSHNWTLDYNSNLRRNF